MICTVCGNPVLHKYAICHDCLQNFQETVRQKRHLFINDMMDQIGKEADEVCAADPTKGKGRGPKWMDG